MNTLKIGRLSKLFLSSAAMTTLLFVTCSMAEAQTEVKPATRPETKPDEKPVESRSGELRSAEARLDFSSYQTIYLAHVTQSPDANDLQSDLRNMLPKSKVYYEPSQRAISIRGSAEDLQLATKIISDLDRARKSYKLTYTITDADGGKSGPAQRFSLVAVSGEKTTMKQGMRVPIVTGFTKEGGTETNAYQYIDIGLNIDVTVVGDGGGVALRAKIEQSTLVDKSPRINSADPVIGQTMLEASAELTDGKPLVLGSLEGVDSVGGARKQQVEVVAELIP